MEVLEPLKNFAALFFGMKVKCMKEQNLVGKVTDRINDGIYQTHAGKILNKLEEKVPKDAFCVAGITMCDIYPKEAWNFVFGLARSPGRTGVYSLARYLLNFGENSYTQIDLDRFVSFFICPFVSCSFALGFKIAPTSLVIYYICCCFLWIIWAMPLEIC